MSSFLVASPEIILSIHITLTLFCNITSYWLRLLFSLMCRTGPPSRRSAPTESRARAQKEEKRQSGWLMKSNVQEYVMLLYRTQSVFRLSSIRNFSLFLNKLLTSLGAFSALKMQSCLFVSVSGIFSTHVISVQYLLTGEFNEYYSCHLVRSLLIFSPIWSSWP